MEEPMSVENTHLLAYLTWDRVAPWKVMAMKDPNKRLFPFAYGSRQRIYFKRAMAGAVLWVATVPRLEVGKKSESKGKQVKNFIAMPPTLVARLKIKAFLCERYDCFRQGTGQEARNPGVAALLKQWGAVATAREEGSVFYGPNDATGFLNSLVFHSAKKATSLKPDENLTESERYMSYAYKLQSIRRINVAESSGRFDLGSSNVLGQQSERTVFLSYVHNDSRNYPAELACELQKQGWNPWFDSLSMPGYRTSSSLRSSIGNKERTRRLAGLIGAPLRFFPKVEI